MAVLRVAEELAEIGKNFNMKNKTPKIYLGIDWGKSKIGLAIGDDHTGVAVPLMVVKNLAEVVKLIKKEAIDKIVLGNPLSMSGQAGGEAKYFQEFLDNLKKEIKQPIELIDERLTSKLADKLRQQAGSKRAKKGAADQDAVAAMLILEAYFDTNKNTQHISHST